MSPPVSELSVHAAAAEAGDRLALIAGEIRWTWAELAAKVGRETERLAAEALEGGAIAPGRPARSVVFDAHPTSDSVIRLLALAEADACAVLLHPRLSRAARAAHVRSIAPCFDLDAGTAIDDSPEHGLEWSARPGASGETSSALAILFTSGTTGAPRAVELSRTAFAASASASGAHLGQEPGDRWLCCLPLAHVGGLSIVARCLLGRHGLVLAGGFDGARVARLMEREAVTLASFVPTMLHQLFALDPTWRAPSTLRAALLGGAAASEDLWAEIGRRELPALETYGMTEACSQIATALPGAPRRLIPLEGMRVRIANGRIEVAGPALCTRIGVAREARPAGAATIQALDDGAPWSRDGFLRTGDVGRFANGVLEVRGRAGETIITGGENVAPAAVEAVLAAHPAIRRAVAFGVPDEEWGEIVAAALEDSGVVPRPSARELHAWLAERLASFERPRRIAWLTQLPETPSGKPDRTATRERCRRAMDAL